MAEWRYIAARLNGDGTETILDPELPLLDASMTKVLSGPDGLRAKLSPATARLLDGSGQPILRPWSTAIFAEQDNVIRHGTIITSLSKDDGGAGLSLTGVGFTAAIKGQPYVGSVFFVQKDPLDIARHIWDHWQSFRGGNLGLQIDRTAKVGKLIGTKLEQVQFDTQAGPVSFEAGPYKLNEWETDDLGGKFDALATDYGFDYREDHAWNAARSGFVHTLDFGVPRIGRRRPDLRFVVGENVMVPPTETSDANAYYDTVLVRGAGEGATMKRAIVPRASETRLRRVYIETDNTLKSTAAAAARGNGLLPFLTGQADVTSIAVYDTPQAGLGSWTEGDEVLLQTDTEWGDSSIWCRILSTTITPDDPNVATCAVVRADKIPS